jgi:hypothetical protein
VSLWRERRKKKRRKRRRKRSASMGGAEMGREKSQGDTKIRMLAVINVYLAFSFGKQQ